MYMLTLKDVQQLLVEEGLLREVVHQGVWHYRVNDPSFLASSFHYLSFDSNDADSDTLFFCKGNRFKADYLKDAAEKGISVYISEQLYETDLTGIIVNDVRKALAVLARAYYDNPQTKLKTIGVTGTKGKTTTVYFVRHILSRTTGNKTALISSLENTVDGKNYTPSHLTTPESLDVFKMMAEAVENGMTHLILEVSSQAFKHDRVYGIHFDIGIFLNISPDHIGPLEHPTFEDYLYCKRQLLENAEIIVLFRGTDHYTLLNELANNQNKQIIVYGTDESDSQYFIENDAANAARFSICPRGKDFLQIHGIYDISMPGDFNKENALSAAIVCALCGASREDCRQGIKETRVPGRMEILTREDGCTAYVDYAHNYISLKKLLLFVKEQHPEGRILVVLGSPGGKGLSRRKDFGLVLSSFADIAYLCADDPDEEDPVKIAEEIQSHMDPQTEAVIIGDRVQAIRQAFSTASSKDAIVIAGKGDARTQTINGKEEPYEGDDVLARKFVNTQLIES